MKPKNIALLSLGILFVIVLFQNIQVVSVRFLFWELSMSRAIFLPLILLIGFVAGFFVGRKSIDQR